MARGHLSGRSVPYAETSFSAKVLSDGRVTIPMIERTLLDLTPGDYVRIIIRKEPNKKGK